MNSYKSVDDSGSAAAWRTKITVVSTVDAVAGLLRDLIVDGSIPPGERITEVAYAERLGCARHTLRAAIQVLVHEGLLERVRNRGVRVPVLRPSDFVDIYHLRSALELEATRIVVMEGRPISGVEEALEALRNVSSNSAPWRELVNLDVHFHRSVINATQSSRLIRAYETIVPEITLSLVRLKIYYDKPVQQITDEHSALLEPILARDWEETQRRWRSHLSIARTQLTRQTDGGEAR